MKHIPNLPMVLDYAYSKLNNTGYVVKANAWQGIQNPVEMFETMDFQFQVPMPDLKEQLIEQWPPSTPWAEMHFQERIGGIPLNPPPSHEHWPFGQKKNKEFRTDDQFDHTYPERFWPKFAGSKASQTKKGLDYYKENNRDAIRGIRFKYGDLDDVIQQLVDDPNTRQAYLPIWFPEDTGAKGGKGRVPCTIGYHFMIRNGYLHITYWMRSCDALRHFKDDIYLAIRLAQHVAGKVVKKLREKDADKAERAVLQMGLLKFHAVSFHVFASEKREIEKRANASK